jgi:hypothetical protein
MRPRQRLRTQLCHKTGGFFGEAYHAWETSYVASGSDAHKPTGLQVGPHGRTVRPRPLVGGGHNITAVGKAATFQPHTDTARVRELS